MANAVISLGSNLGDRAEKIRSGVIGLEKSGCRVLKKSALYETEPWGNTDQPAFLNQVIQIESPFEPAALMQLILLIEREAGRERKTRWEPRTLDIDILFYDDRVVQEHHLAIPHPHLHDRKFVLVPLAEILPGFVHPVLGKKVSELLEALKDPLRVEPIPTPSAAWNKS